MGVVRGRRSLRRPLAMIALLAAPLRTGAADRPDERQRGAESGGGADEGQPVDSDKGVDRRTSL